MPSKYKQKIKNFKKWLLENKDIGGTVGELIVQMPYKKLENAMTLLKRWGYCISDQGIPLVDEEGEEYKGFILAAFRALSNATGKPLLIEHIRELNRRSYLRAFRKWLTSFSKLDDKPDWWRKINWSAVGYETLATICVTLKEGGYKFDEDATPTNADDKLPQALEASILVALTEAASVY